ncbi:MAG: Rieske 2Fe-2S domain-containing protein [Alphaproteobacteria bacterium]
MSDIAKAVRASAPYSGYSGRLATRENVGLTHIDKGTPAGEYLRRFWQPLAIAADVKDVALKVDLLGEKLVVFRDKSGRWGVLDRHCSHRGSSLEFGLIRERGIQCCYHGWHFDVDGRILDIPGSDDGDDFKNTFCHGAYPAREYKGIVFAYLGPPDRAPAFPIYDFMEFPDEELVPVAWDSPCNWLQVRENTQDPMHVSFLHTMFGTPQFGPWSYDIPWMTWCETPIGQITIAARHTHGRLYARVNELILPNFARVPDLPPLGISDKPTSPRGRGLSLWVIPRDNVNSTMIGWFHFTSDMDAAWRRQVWDMTSLGQSCDRPYEQRQRYPGDWDAWTSQGAIAVQANECLRQSDGGIALFRTQLRKGIRAVQKGTDPKGLLRGRNAPIRSYAGNLFEPAPQGLSEPDVKPRLKDFAERVKKQVLAGR